MGLLLATGDPSKGDALLTQALALGQTEAQRPLAAARVFQDIGRILFDRGRQDSSRQFWTTALAMQARLAPDSLDMARSLNGLALVLWRQGNLTDAAEHLQRARAIEQKVAPDSLDLARSWNGLGIVAFEQGDLLAAEDYFTRAVAIQERLAPDSVDLARSLNNLGVIANKTGDLRGSTAYYQRALAVYEKLAPDSIDVAHSSNNLGLLVRDQGDLTGARRYLQRALELYDKLAPDSTIVAHALNNLGQVERTRGDLVAAERYYRRALSIKEKLAPNSLDLMLTLYNLGMAEQGLGNWPKANHFAYRAWALVRQQAETVSGDEARQAYDASNSVYAASLLKTQTKLGQLAPAFTTLEESRAQALQQLLLDRQLLAGRGNTGLWSSYPSAIADRDHVELAVSQASIEATLARRQVLAAQERGDPPAAILRAKTAAEAAANQLERAQIAYTRARTTADELWAHIKKTAPQVFTRPISLPQAQQVLPPDTLYLAFSVGPEQSYLFLLRSDRGARPSLRIYRLAPSAETLAQRVRHVELALSRPGQAGGRGNQELFAALFPTEVQQVLKGRQRLLISPDGPLWELPFAALVTNSQGRPHYLGETHPITYTASLTLFAQTRNQRRERSREKKPVALVVGNPIFEQQTQTASATQPVRSIGERSALFSSGVAPPPLPGTALEATRVARLYSTQPLLGARATEAAVRQRIGAAAVVHLATHGYLNPHRAMSSGLLLSAPAGQLGTPDPANDGALQAWEIYSQLKLRADLVVLSACETGRGDDVVSEGIVGLTRALQVAGARSIVATQWKVADASTARFMVAFHQKLLAGLSKDEALRQAMNLLRRNPLTADPYYWAPFVLIGDPENGLLPAAPTKLRVKKMPVPDR